MLVKDVMTRDVLTVEPGMPLRALAELLVERRISGVPVVDGGGLVGVVSEADFLAKEAGLPEQTHGRLHAFRKSSADDKRRTALIEARTAGDAMTSPAITVAPDRPLAEAARIMQQHQVNRLPVVDGDTLVGIVTRADVVRSFVRDDGEIDAQVRHALRAVDGISIGVRQGIVTISGWIPDRSLIPTIESLVSHVPGVVAVEMRVAAPVSGDRDP